MLAKQAGEDGDDEDWEEDDAEETALEGYTTTVDDEDNIVDEYHIFKVILQSEFCLKRVSKNIYVKECWADLDRPSSLQISKPVTQHGTRYSHNVSMRNKENNFRTSQRLQINDKQHTVRPKYCLSLCGIAKNFASFTIMENHKLSCCFQIMPFVSDCFQNQRWSRSTEDTSSRFQWCRAISISAAAPQEWIESFLPFPFLTVTDCSEWKCVCCSLT